MMYDQTSRRVGVRAIAALAVSALALSSCGKATEIGTEQLIESQSGGEVDLDLDGDGGFSVQTEEGGMTIDEDGNFVITGADGETITGSADGESGEFNAESSDGEFNISSDGDIPEEWPDDVPVPEGIESATSTMQSSGNELAIFMGGPGDPSFVDDYGSVLESAGFELESTMETQDSALRTYVNDTWTVAISAFGDEDTQVSVSLYNSAP